MLIAALSEGKLASPILNPHLGAPPSVWKPYKTRKFCFIRRKLQFSANPECRTWNSTLGLLLKGVPIYSGDER